MTSPYRVVLVDDVDDLRFLVRLALERSGRFEVVGEAANGQDAVHVARELQPDIVLLDVSMPKQDGLETLPLLRREAPAAKVIMLTGFEAGRLAERAQELGATGYLEKGLPPDYIVRAVAEIVESDGRPRVVQAPSETVYPRSAMSSDDALAFVAHEVRSPLAVIQGLGMTLGDRWAELPDDQRADLVRRMTANATYADSVLANVEHMRAHGDVANLHFSHEDVGRLLTSIAHDVASLAKGRDLTVEVPEGLPRVKVDVHRLRQVLINLIVNATKHSPEGSAITLWAAREDGAVAISVSDEGTGIPEDMRDAVFERFVQVDSGAKGLGLGLYICRRMIEALGGRIWVADSRVGTTIRLTLPTVDP